MMFEQLCKREDVPVVMANASGFIIHVNDAFCTVFRWGRDSLEGKSLTRIIPAIFMDAHHLGFARHLETGRRSVIGLSVTLPVVCGDGNVADAEHYILDGTIDGVVCYAASIVPVEKG